MPTLTKQELKDIVRGELKTATADRVLAAEEEAREELRKRQLDGDLRGKDAGTIVAEAARAEAARLAGAQGDRSRGIVTHDPLGGRGLEFARWVKLRFAAAKDNRPMLDIARQWGAEHPGYAELARVMTEGNLSAGGSLAPPQFSSDFIELLRPKTVALEMGARTLDFKGSLEIGKQNAGATAYYVGEAQNITPSQPTTGTLTLKARKLACLVPLSNDLLRNPSAGADAFVRDDLLRVMALKRDLSIFRGAGTEHSPRGVSGWINSANKFNQAGTTAANKIADLMKAISLVDGADVPLTQAGFVMAPRTKWGLMSTVDGNGNLIFAPMLTTGSMFGFKVGTTSQIPINLSSTQSEIYFGEFPELVVGLDLPLEVETFLNGTYFDGSALVSGISSDQSVIRALERHDVVLRHDKSFSMIEQVTWA